MGKLIPFAEWQSQNRTVGVYRDRFGYPRIEQPDEIPRAHSLAIVIACAGLVCLVAWVAS